MTRLLPLRIAALFALAMVHSLACAQAGTQQPRVAGTIELAEGDVMIEGVSGKPRLARVGENVYEADLVTTFPKAELHLHMADDAYLSVREKSKIRIAAYVADGGSADRSWIDLVSGTLRVVSGWIGRYNRPNYRITAANVTIGVRGTDHEPMHLLPGDSRGDPGVYDKVNDGSTFIQPEGGPAVEVPKGRVVFRGASGAAAPRLLQATPAFYKPGVHEERFVARSREIVPAVERRRVERQEAVRRSSPAPAPARPEPAAARPSPAVTQQVRPVEREPLAHPGPAPRKVEERRIAPVPPTAKVVERPHSPVAAKAPERPKVERHVEKKAEEDRKTAAPRAMPHR